jgi:hypothetical protein
MSSGLIRASLYGALLALVVVVAPAGGVDARRCLAEVISEVSDGRTTRTVRECVLWDDEVTGGGGGGGDSGGERLGGGSGGQSRCTSTPYGPLSEVRAIWDAVTRRQDPNLPPPPPGADPVTSFGPVVGAWYRVTASRIEILYQVTCVNPPSSDTVWVTVTPTAGGGLTPEVTPEDLIPGLFDRVKEMLPTPVPRVAPADSNPDGFAFVQAETFFWVDQAPGQWEEVSATSSVAGLWVSITAAPVELIVSTGDGAIVRCPGAPPAFPPGADPDAFVGCEHVYTDSSAMAPNGETFPVTVTVVWHNTWQASTGESGGLGVLSTTSAVRELPVAEIQAVVVEG